MKYLKRFGQKEKEISIYDQKWEQFLPSNLVVIKEYDDGQHSYHFKKGNVMIHSDMLQITYESDHIELSPDTLEIDVYFANDVIENRIEFSVDITFGDEVVCEFKVEPPNKVNIIQSTSYNSKFDPTNTIFAFEIESLKQLISFWNRFDSNLNLSLRNFEFLYK